MILLRKLYIVFCIALLSCSSNPYDTSTPEKFVASMGLIGQQPREDNPLPYFYEAETAQAITRFDETGEEGLIAFNKFRESIARQFPNHTKMNVNGKLKIALDGYVGRKIRNFSYSASLVGAQLKERKPKDYEFVSVTDSDEENVCQLTIKISGREKTLPIKKTAQGYRMFLSKEVLDNIERSIEKVQHLTRVFDEANQLLDSEQITTQNFEEKLSEIFDQYEDALK